MTDTRSTAALYLPPLDGLRTLAFLLVFLHHHPPTPALSLVHRQGWVGVELFFAISAFLFFHLFRAEHERAGRISASTFMLRRALRLYPLLIAFSIAMLIYGLTTGPLTAPVAAGRFIGLVGFFDNFLIWTNGYNQIPFTAHLWTIAYEFQIYLIMPAAYMAFVRWGRRRFLYGLLAVWLFALMARLAFSLMDAPYPIWVTPFLRPESTLVGIALSTGVLDRLKAPVVIAITAAAIVAVGFLPHVIFAGRAVMIIYPVVAIAAGALLWLATHTAWAGRSLAIAPLRYLGKISYGLYVYHLAAQYFGWNIAAAFGFDRATTIGYCAGFGITLALTIVVSAISYRVLELPFLRMKQKFAVVTGRAV